MALRLVGSKPTAPPRPDAEMRVEPGGHRAFVKATLPEDIPPMLQSTIGVLSIDYQPDDGMRYTLVISRISEREPWGNGEPGPRFCIAADLLGGGSSAFLLRGDDPVGQFDRFFLATQLRCSVEVAEVLAPVIQRAICRWQP